MKTQLWVWTACLAGAVILGCGGDSISIKPSGTGVCGDGTWNEGEECDDGNVDDGDGCSSLCFVEDGYDCKGNICKLIKASETCGNGVVDEGEACDDSNTESGDGCAANCLFVEKDYNCPSKGGACTPKSENPVKTAVCGDGNVDKDIDEECDDGNTDDDDGCSSECRVENGYECPVAGEPCKPSFAGGSCGDGTLDIDEFCDDGNLENGDGCSDTCVTESGWTCGEDTCFTTCGDGFTVGTEICDDGNTDDGDGCSADCMVMEEGFQCMDIGGLTFCMEKGCGNYEVEGSEECDEGEESKNQEGISYGWRENVSKPYCFMCHYTGYCGDGKVNGDEECDEGIDSNGNPRFNESGLPIGGDGSYGHCTADCKLGPRCGDGTIQKGEDCDKGKDLNVGGYSLNPSADICTSMCTFGSYCGDGVLDKDHNEECDDGKYGNTGAYGGCTANCKKAPYCGDSIVDSAAGEECDNGNNNKPSGYGTCNSSTCTWNAICGDGHVDTANAEECDDGVFVNGKIVGNDGSYEGCKADCKKASFCGDKVLDSKYEDCDGVTGCTANCMAAAGYECKNNVCTKLKCGNGVMDSGELCDDGIAAQSAYCKGCSPLAGYVCLNGTPACPAGKCTTANPCIAITSLYGDGVISPDFEDCDDGNKTDNDGCTKGYVDPGYICPKAGQRCVAAACGDGIRAYGEACDDGNNKDNDGCSSRCLLENGYSCTNVMNKLSKCVTTKGKCGDSIIQQGEECDDGNTTSGDGCSSSCKIESKFKCAYSKNADGIRVNGGACSSASNLCGNGVLNKKDGSYIYAEQCDLGTANNGASGSGCDANCRITTGYHCNAAGTSCTKGKCRNGILDAGEECDDGNHYPNDGCSPSCKREAMFDEYTDDSTGKVSYSPKCGDGITLWMIAKRDANGRIMCQNGSVLAAGQKKEACPNGKYVPAEACDDGNMISGDGCSSQCEVENGWKCTDWAATASGATIDMDITYYDFRSPTHSGTGDGYLTQAFISEMISRDSSCNNKAIKSYCTISSNSSCVGRGYPDFECVYGGSGCKGMVKSTLDSSNKPVLDYSASDCTKNHVTCRGSHYYWYRAVPGINKKIVSKLTMNRQSEGVYQFSSTSWYPLANQGYYSSENGSNQAGNFTSELHTFFQYKGGEKLNFKGDDDVWAFINHILFVDLGGMQSGNTASGTLSEAPCVFDGTASDIKCDPKYDIYEEGIYELHFFQAERCSSGSQYTLTLAGFLKTGQSTCTCTNTSLCSNNCGNGKVDAGEECDCDANGNNCKNAAGTAVKCNIRTCKLSSCGDGVLDTRNGEECDLGKNKNGTPTSYCTSTCKIQKCGDGEVGPGEECDQGSSNSASAYGPNKCTNTCKNAPYCGDGVKNGSEKCDNGKANRDLAYGANTCTTSCEIGGYCGDGKVNGREKCDNGTANNKGEYGGCNADCTLAPRCGDKVIDAGEQCDNGAANNNSAYGATACLATCKKAPYCGDGTVNGPEGREMCDNGKDNSANAYGPNACTDKCMKAGYCGDGIKNGNEACDNGAENNVDGVYGGCSSSCTLNGYCGDGVVNGAEECDFVATPDGSCTTLCKKKVN